MKQLILITFLVLNQGTAYADWLPFGTTEDGVIYIDLDNIRRKGNVVKIWTLTDEKSEQPKNGQSYLSTQLHHQYDCEEETVRFLAMFYRSEKMGEGKLVHSITTASEWMPIPPNGLLRDLLRMVCKK
jgi:hypothetical protein